MKKTQVILPAAGVGARLKSSLPKPLVMLNGKPIVLYSLAVFEQCSLIDSVIIVSHEQNLEDFEKVVRTAAFKKVKKIVPGGATRCESVSKGLEFLDDETEFVLIHDAARPLISARVVEHAVKLCYDEAAVIVAVPVKPTIKQVHTQKLFVEKTLDRKVLWEVQTPQVFDRDVIVKAHKKVRDINATDDAAMVEKIGQRVKVLRGDYTNIKITTPEDLIFAEGLLNALVTIK